MLVRFLAYTELRFGEVAALRVSDFDFARRRIRVERAHSEAGGHLTLGPTKSGKPRTVLVPEFIVDEVRPLVADRATDSEAFRTTTGRPIRVSNWGQRTMRDAMTAATAEDKSFPHGVTAHTLRHTAASLAISSGANVKAVQRMLGHASAAMTLDTYADLFDDDLEQVATALDKGRQTALKRSEGKR